MNDYIKVLAVVSLFLYLNNKLTLQQLVMIPVLPP